MQIHQIFISSANLYFALQMHIWIQLTGILNLTHPQMNFWSSQIRLFHSLPISKWQLLFLFAQAKTLSHSWLLSLTPCTSKFWELYSSSPTKNITASVLSCYSLFSTLQREEFLYNLPNHVTSWLKMFSSYPSSSRVKAKDCRRSHKFLHAQPASPSDLLSCYSCTPPTTLF